MTLTAPSREELLAYMSGEGDADISRKIEMWFCHNGKSDEAAELLYGIWNDWALMNPSAGSEDTRRAFESFLRRLSLNDTGKAASRTHKKARLSIWLYRCAAVLIIPLCILSVSLYRSSIADDSMEWTGKYVALGSIDTLTMPDGSKVWLNSGSRIIYPEKFRGQFRQVYLDGEGVFDVVSDSKMPMVIRTGNTSVKVYGTKFNLKAYPEESITEISLLEGSVEFSVSGREDARYSMAPGETITYDKENSKVSMKRFSVADYTSWKDHKYYFRNKSLEYIARQLERTFNVTIIIRNEEIRDTKYHMAFVNGESIDEILHYIKMYSNVSVVRNGDVIEIL